MHIRNHRIALLILLASCITGLYVYRDYGISWDEISQREIGLYSYRYIFHDENTLATFQNRDYGVAFELPLIFIEKLLRLEDSRSIFLMRHLVTHLFFLFSAFIFYLLIFYLNKNTRLALLGYLALLLSPKIYPHSFFNTKDVPFLSLFIICFFLCAVAFRKNKQAYFIAFGVGTGLLINTRIMGVMIFFFATFFFLLDFFMHDRKRKIILHYSAYCVSSVVTLIVSWPYLWSDPSGNFTEAWVNMSAFRFDDQILMFGDFVRSTKLNWTYVPAWFTLTTPIAYLIFGLLGCFLFIAHFINHPLNILSDTLERNYLLFLLCSGGSVLSVILLHSVLYDGWRQLYYIYPPIILMSIYCISFLLKKSGKYMKTTKLLLAAVMGISFLNTFRFMINNHPFQDVYFNALVSKENQHLRKNFEMDYWGTSYKQALEYILEKDPSDSIQIMVANDPGKINTFILDSKDRKRLFVCVLKDEDRNKDNRIEDTRDATYFISNYRWHPTDYGYPPDKVIFNIQVSNSDIISVWKVK